MGWVLIAFQNALWQMLHAPSFEEGVVDTVMQGGDTDTNAAAMMEAAGTVTTMSVTYAARDSLFDGMEIKKGDYLGMVNGKVLEVERSLADCIGKMADEGLRGDETYINVFYGEGVTEEQANEAQTLLSEHLPDAEINVINGGQPVYYFVISAE
jgi:dihydroxyacetone kinase-like predicted kinase